MMTDDLLHSALDELDRERLIGVIIKQAQAIEALRDQVGDLKEANEHLRSQVEAAQREGKRQAAPFRRSQNKRVTTPSEPGRKPGHEGAARPRPDCVDEYVDVALEHCPRCGSQALRDLRPLRQFVEELPPPQVRVTELVTYRGECQGCGQTVESAHPLKTSGATGAAGVHLGPRAKAVATSLVYEQGLTVRKACCVLERLWGLELSPGGLSQLAHCTAARLEAKDAELQEAARAAAVQYVDETSWWVAASEPERQPHWLWVFANHDQTLYRIDHRRNREVIEETLGSDFPGVLVSDCLQAYEEVASRQHKCYAHHLKALSEAQAEHTARCGEASAYLGHLRALLRAAMALKAVAEEISTERFETCRAALEQRADALLSEQAPRDGPAEEAVRNRLSKQRRHLFVFLDHDQVEATNNVAERRLRPAVIRRKLSCGNQTERGARTWEILASLAATCAQQGRSFVELVREALAFEPEPVPVR